MPTKNQVLMTYHILVNTNRNGDGGVSTSKINIKGIEEIEEFLPDENQLRLWAQETAIKYKIGIPSDLIHIKVKPDIYFNLVKKIYFKIGKQVSLHDPSKLLFRIPMKKGNAFF